MYLPVTKSLFLFLLRNVCPTLNTWRHGGGTNVAYTINRHLRDVTCISLAKIYVGDYCHNYQYIGNCFFDDY